MCDCQRADVHKLKAELCVHQRELQQSKDECEELKALSASQLEQLAALKHRVNAQAFAQVNSSEGEFLRLQVRVFLYEHCFPVFSTIHCVCSCVEHSKSWRM